MSNAGRTDPEDAAPRSVWVFLGGLLILVIGGLFIGVQVLSVVVAALFPPVPPVPPNAMQIASGIEQSGDVTWRYSVQQNACDVTQWYKTMGTCDRTVDCVTSPGTLARVAVCEGQQPFSQFVMRWSATISVDQQDRDETVIVLMRRIIWTPVATP